MSVVVDLQLALDDDDADSPGAPPSSVALERWVAATLAAAAGPADAELTARVVGRDESAELNATYRQRSGPTNVLSFPFEAPVELADQPEVAAELAAGLLGDLVICAPVVVAEAAAQGKAVEAHWAHMVVHGTLHLLGHDHGDDHEAEVMERLERRILAELGYPDPYVNESES